MLVGERGTVSTCHLSHTTNNWTASFKSDDTASEFPTEGLVECHADFLSRNLPYIPIRKRCKGQFCVIAASEQGDVYRQVFSTPTVALSLMWEYLSDFWSFSLHETCFQVFLFRGCMTLDQSKSERKITVNGLQYYSICKLSATVLFSLATISLIKEWSSGSVRRQVATTTFRKWRNHGQKRWQNSSRLFLPYH